MPICTGASFFLQLNSSSRNREKVAAVKIVRYIHAVLRKTIVAKTSAGPFLSTSSRAHISRLVALCIPVVHALVTSHQPPPETNATLRHPRPSLGVSPAYRTITIIIITTKRISRIAFFDLWRVRRTVRRRSSRAYEKNKKKKNRKSRRVCGRASPVHGRRSSVSAAAERAATARGCAAVNWTDKKKTKKIVLKTR